MMQTTSTMSKIKEQVTLPQAMLDGLSRKFSKILRHTGPDLGLIIGKDGFTELEKLLELPTIQKLGISITTDDIRELAKTNAKQRFSSKSHPMDQEAIDDNEPKGIQIRANQGHSIPHVTLEAVCGPLITELREGEICCHGAYNKFVSKIIAQGLKAAGRAIHMAPALPGNSVISGMRGTCEVIVHINFPRAVKGGIRFYRSTNGVILSDGVNGIIPSQYISSIQSVNNGQTLYCEGQEIHSSLVAQEKTNAVENTAIHKADSDDYMYYWMDKTFLTPVFALTNGVGNELITDNADFIYVFTDNVTAPERPTIDTRNRGYKILEGLQASQNSDEICAKYTIIELHLCHAKCPMLLQESKRTRFDPHVTDEDISAMTKELRELIDVSKIERSLKKQTQRNMAKPLLSATDLSFFEKRGMGSWNYWVKYSQKK